MGSYRKVGDDILKEWLDFREEELGSLTCKEDEDQLIHFEEISTDILNNISGNNIEYVKDQLKNFIIMIIFVMIFLILNSLVTRFKRKVN